MPEKLLRIKEVMTRCGVRRSFIYKHANLGDFPAPVKLSAGRRAPIAWRESDIDEWIKSRELAVAVHGESPD